MKYKDTTSGTRNVCARDHWNNILEKSLQVCDTQCWEPLWLLLETGNTGLGEIGLIQHCRIYVQKSSIYQYTDKVNSLASGMPCLGRRSRSEPKWNHSTILWPELDFSKREKRKWGEQESQHRSVNECAISQCHNTSLGHDQWSPSRPGWVRSGLSGHGQWGPREPAAPGHCFHCWTRKSLLSPPRICWVNPDISQPSPLLSPAVPVWRRAAGDPARPYIFQEEPLGCQQEDSTLIVTQESLTSWDKTLIAASSPRGCRWHGFHHYHHPPARLRHFGNLLPILDEQMSDWRGFWECFFSPPPAPLAF